MATNATTTTSGAGGQYGGTPTKNSNNNNNNNKEAMLNDLLMCGICLSRMTAPACLPCAHSFCRTCLLEYAQNGQSSTMANAIACPFCKNVLAYRSLHHLDAMLIVNPTLNQLCQALDSFSLDGSSAESASNANNRARCHACSTLKTLKVCKHCCFMLCETCRRSHLLDVHKDSRVMLDTLEQRLRQVSEKRGQLNTQAGHLDNMRAQLHMYVQRLHGEIDRQARLALRDVNECAKRNEQLFWTHNGFENEDKLNSFIALYDSAREKLSAKNITDKELMELSEHLQTTPDLGDLERIRFAPMNLLMDDALLNKQWVRLVSHEQQEASASARGEVMQSPDEGGEQEEEVERVPVRGPPSGVTVETTDDDSSSDI